MQAENNQFLDEFSRNKKANDLFYFHRFHVNCVISWRQEECIQKKLQRINFLIRKYQHAEWSNKR